MKNTPIDYQAVKSVIDSFNLPNFGRATIREIVAITAQIEAQTGKRFVHTEMGVPGLQPARVGTEAEIKALENGVASKYPILDGLPELKTQTSRFVKAFVDVDVPSKCCIPVVGSMQGTYAAFLVAGQCNPAKNTFLFLDPGFPVQKLQLEVLGYKYESIDVYDCRGEALIEKIRLFFEKGNVAAVIFSNPNNPSWVCLQETELEGIGKLATQHDVIVVEDLAYFGMDFRRAINKPFEPPFQVSVSKYTDNYIMLISSSKVFSYAGQRIGVAAISQALFKREYEALKARYGVGTFGNVFVNRVLYSLTAGVSHSTQYALAAMLRAAADGCLDFFEDMKTYARRAEKMKRMFIENGFEIVYAADLDEPIGDGFYFTVRYPTMTGAELMEELMYYGISSISLETTGSSQQGLRICTSFISDEQYDDLAYRLQAFAENHPLN